MAQDQDPRSTGALVTPGEPAPPEAPAADPHDPAAKHLSNSALEHYQRGNRFFDLKALDQALEEWRRSTKLWGLARRAPRSAARPFAQLRAVVLLLLTVLLVYNVIFTLFPRNPFDMILMGGGSPSGRPQLDQRSWWDRWLDTGRSSGRGGDGERVTLREWWQSLGERWRQSGEGQGRGGGIAGRPRLDQRWEELLRRYGRFGPSSGGMNYYLTAGNGLGKMGDYEGAVAAFEKGLTLTKQPVQLGELYQALANTHYYHGYKLQPDGLATYNLALVKKAAEAYERSTEYETRPLSFGNLGWTHFLLGDYKRAESYSRRALSLDPSLDYVRLNLGLVYLFQGRVEDSYGMYLQVIRRNPAAESYMGGINDLREVLRDHPGRYPFAYLMMGVLALKMGDFGQAKFSLQRFLAAPNVPENWRGRAERMLRTMDISDVER